MRCKCGNTLKVKTDPQGGKFVLSEGLKKVMEKAHEEREAHQQKEVDAFSKLENIQKDKLIGIAEKPRLEKLL